MKLHFVLSTLFVLCGGPLMAQGVTPSQSPSVYLPPDLATALFGKSDYSNPNASSQGLNCFVLLNQTLNYGSALAIGLCNEAQMACLRYGVLQQALFKQKNTKSGNAQFLQELKAALALSLKDVEFKLTGCAMSMSSTGSLLDDSGFAPKSSTGQAQ